MRDYSMALLAAASLVGCLPGFEPTQTETETDTPAETIDAEDDAALTSAASSDSTTVGTTTGDPSPTTMLPGTETAATSDTTSGLDEGQLDTADSQSSGPVLAMQCTPDLSPLQWSVSSTVSNDVFTLGFGNNLVNRMPDELTAGSGNLLGGTGVGAQQEQLIGVNYFPRAYSWSMGMGDSTTLTVEHEGPAFVQVTLDWVGYDGGATTRYMNGRTRYSFIPDGRMIRDDRVTVETGQVMSWLISGLVFDHGGSPDQWAASWGFDKPGELAALEVAETFTEDIAVEDGAPRWFCVERQSTDDVLAFAAYRLAAESEIDGGGVVPRLGARLGVRETYFTLAFDWVRQSDVPAGDYFSRSMVLVGDANPKDADLCGCGRQQSVAYLDPTPLGLDGGGAFIVDDPLDSDGDSYVEGAGYHAVRALRGASGVRFDIPEDMPPSTLVRIADLGSPTSLALHLEGSDGLTELIEGSEFVWQPDGDQGVFVYIAGQLPAGAVLEVAAQE